MSFEKYLLSQLQLHPCAQPQDVVKQCYQAAFGAEHLLTDPEKASACLTDEFNSVSACDGELYEPVSPDYCRINLAVWKHKGLPLEWLFRIFTAPHIQNGNAHENFGMFLLTAEKAVREGKTQFSAAQWEEYLTKYKEAGMPAVHHSGIYRKTQQPAYRIAQAPLCRAVAVLEKICSIPRKKPCIIAIDGKAASGKTTLAKALGAILDADIIHTDDFFLPPALRSEERLRTPGGNTHHERFALEILPFIRGNAPFSYRIFDCSIMDYNGTREIAGKPFIIIEGSYSCHPVYGKYADITVFSDISAELQSQRILKRNGERLHQMFLTRWIPLEEAYFSHYNIKNNADIIL